jgi:hypothetical protein
MNCPKCGSEMEELFGHKGEYRSSYCRKCEVQKVPGCEGYYTMNGHESKLEVDHED